MRGSGFLKQREKAKNCESPTYLFRKITYNSARVSVNEQDSN